MYELKNTKQVELSDRIRFRCMRCANCCRHVEATIMIEVKDAFILPSIWVLQQRTSTTNIPRCLCWKTQAFLCLLSRLSEMIKAVFSLKANVAAFKQLNREPAGYIRFGYFPMITEILSITILQSAGIILKAR